MAALTCQYASRPSVVQTIAPTYSGANGGATYQTNVTTYIANALQTQQFGYTQTNATPFTYTVNGPADVRLAATVPTTLMKIFRVTQLSVGATAHCYDNASSITQTVPDGPTQNLIQESFEVSGCGAGSCAYYYGPNGTGAAVPALGVTSTFSSTPAYTGAGGRQWFVIGTCLEVDNVGTIESTVPDGTHSVELDCNGNSSMSTKVYVPAGSYELRYFYKARVSYPEYAPAFICGSAASDVSWATNLRAVGGPLPTALKTNQINAYFDLDANGPPLHTTLDGLQTLAGSNLIDVCVYSANWIERSVRINVATAGFYWLSFAADGTNDTYGGQIDNVRLCQKTCAGTLQDNFPASWLAANNGGVLKELFRDRFESPSYPGTGCSGQCNVNGDMNASLGTSGTAASGWPGALPAGWVAAPYNQVDYVLSGAPDGTQSLELDATAAFLQTTSNRAIARRFLLDPGYYRVDYWYKASVTNAAFTTNYCGATPAAAGLTVVPTGYDTNFVGLFANHFQMASTPNANLVLNGAVTYTNPNGTVTASPTVPPNAISYTNYNPNQPNPLLDLCGYAPAWTARTATMKIQKPGYYWLTLSALGTADASGGRIDDVRLTALGSLSLSPAPSGAVTVPVPDPQPGANIVFSGFSIVADPLVAPAPLP